MTDSANDTSNNALHSNANSMPDTQAAVIMTDFGQPDVLDYRTDIQVPILNDKEVLIKIAYAGVNPVDTKTRQGKGWAADNIKQGNFTMVENGKSAILGFDVAGEVVESHSKYFNVGDRVAALNFDGGCYAQYINVPDSLLAKVPDDIELKKAGALSCVGTTAKQLIDAANISHGDHVVLSAPAGGVGHIAVQILINELDKNNLKLTVVCSPDKFDKLTQLIDTRQLAGWIDYTKDEPYPTLDADVLLDLVGWDAGVRSLALLKDHAKAVVLPTNGVDKVAEAGKARGIEVTGFRANPNGEDLEKVLNMVEKNQIKLVINQTFALKDAAEAHRVQEAGSLFGKLVLEVDAD